MLHNSRQMIGWFSPMRVSDMTGKPKALLFTQDLVFTARSIRKRIYCLRLNCYEIVLQNRFSFRKK